MQPDEIRPKRKERRQNQLMRNRYEKKADSEREISRRGHALWSQTNFLCCTLRALHCCILQPSEFCHLRLFPRAHGMGGACLYLTVQEGLQQRTHLSGWIWRRQVRLASGRAPCSEGTASRWWCWSPLASRPLPRRRSCLPSLVRPVILVAEVGRGNPTWIMTEHG